MPRREQAPLQQDAVAALHGGADRRLEIHRHVQLRLLPLLEEGAVQLGNAELAVGNVVHEEDVLRGDLRAEQPGGQTDQVLELFQRHQRLAEQPVAILLQMRGEDGPAGHFQDIRAGMEIGAHQPDEHVAVGTELQDPQQKAGLEKADQRVRAVALLQPEILDGRLAAGGQERLLVEARPGPQQTALPVEQGKGDVRDGAQPLACSHDIPHLLHLGQILS